MRTTTRVQPIYWLLTPNPYYWVLTKTTNSTRASLHLNFKPTSTFWTTVMWWRRRLTWMKETPYSLVIWGPWSTRAFSQANISFLLRSRLRVDTSEMMKPFKKRVQPRKGRSTFKTIYRITSRTGSMPTASWNCFSNERGLSLWADSMINILFQVKTHWLIKGL